MNKDNTEVVVDRLPNCDVSAAHGPASYDAKTKDGPWGYLCEECYGHLGIGLGLGLGQRLVVRS